MLWKGGGGLNALGRHTVAALLNASSGSVSYGQTEGNVITSFDVVFPGSKKQYNSVKAEFESENESGCPLN